MVQKFGSIETYFADADGCRVSRVGRPIALSLVWSPCSPATCSGRAGAPRREEAHSAVERCAEALEAFESEAFARDDRQAGEPSRLRAVEDRR